MVNVGKDYNQTMEGLSPIVTSQMGQEAAMVLLGHATDIEDARYLLSALGISTDILAGAKAARHGARV